MALYRDETFGPVVSIYRFDDVEDAVRQANASEYGLNASVWSHDLRCGRELGRAFAAARSTLTRRIGHMVGTCSDGRHEGLRGGPAARR